MKNAILNDFIKSKMSPLDSYFMSLDRPFVALTPVSHCRGLCYIAFACGENSKHPFIKTLQQYKLNKYLTYTDSILRSYYQKTVTSAADVLATRNFHMRNLDPLSAVLPWLTWSSEKRKRFWLRTILKENKKFSCINVGEMSGFQLFGPVSQAKGDLEFKRLIQVYTSIVDNGYIRDPFKKDGDIVGCLMVNDSNDFRVMINSGQHRIAAAAAAGLDEIPVRFNSLGGCPRIVYRRDSTNWPNVRNNIYTAHEAIEIFDRIFDGSGSIDY